MNGPGLPDDYAPAPDLLVDKTILITGAGDGIGRAAAECYARHGATVILLGRTQEKLEAVYDAIEREGGPQPALFPMDLATATEDDYAGLAGAIESTFGRLDGLLHNASVLGERRPIANASWRAWSEVMQVNVNAPFLLTRGPAAAAGAGTPGVHRHDIVGGGPPRTGVLGCLRGVEVRH